MEQDTDAVLDSDMLHILIFQNDMYLILAQDAEDTLVDSDVLHVLKICLLHSLTDKKTDFDDFMKLLL